MGFCFSQHHLNRHGLVTADFQARNAKVRRVNGQNPAIFLFILQQVRRYCPNTVSVVFVIVDRGHVVCEHSIKYYCSFIYI